MISSYCSKRPLLWHKKLARLFFDKVDRDWETAWAQSVTPWETRKCSAPLQYALNNDNVLTQSRLMFKPDSYALVPGCGSGYDPILLGTANENSSSPYFANVIGLDLSKTAIDVCESNLKAHMSGSEGASLKALEYHSEQTQWEGGATMRGRWAQSMRRLLRPESGLLATLVFPTRPGQEGLPAKAEGDTGPPFTVTLGSYAEVLVPLGFECIAAAPVPEQASIKPRRGREVMAYWKLHPE